MGDLMHTGPLGVLSWFLGAVMYELVVEGVWEGTETERVNRLWEEITLEYTAQGATNRLTLLKLSMLYHGQHTYPCFTSKA
eukprot:2853280-Pyramimonas_sp.AAC.1